MKEQEEKNLPTPTKGTFLEHVCSVLSIGVAAIPVGGGPASVTLGMWVQSEQQKRWEKYWQAIEEQVAKIEQNMISEDFIKSEEFAFRLRALHQEVTTSAGEEKLEYLKNYLLASMWKVGSDISWRNLFWDHVKLLTGSHLSILRHFYDVQKDLSYNVRFRLPQMQENCPLTVSSLHNALPEFEEKLINVLCADLEARGLVRMWQKGKTKDQMAWSITDTGIMLMRFLCLEWKL